MAQDSPHSENSNTTSTTVVGALVIILAVVSVAARFWTRHFTRAGYGWDDHLILLALVATIVTDILVLVSTSIDPNGEKVASDEDPNYVFTQADILYTKLNFIAAILYFTITSATKLSILFMYNRLFSISKSFRRQVLVVGALVVAFWIGCTVANLLNCRPLKYTWINSLDDPRYCFNYNIFWLVSGIVEAIIDVLIIAMPVRIVFGLQLNLTKKIALIAVFLLGTFVIITGIVKVVLSYAPGNREPSFIKTEVWTTVHCGIGMVCACLPVCWPLVSKLRPASVQKHWNTFSRWSAEKSISIRRSTLPDTERGDTPTGRDSNTLLVHMDDLDHNGLRDSQRQSLQHSIQPSIDSR